MTNPTKPQTPEERADDGYGGWLAKATEYADAWRDEPATHGRIIADLAKLLRDMDRVGQAAVEAEREACASLAQTFATHAFKETFEDSTDAESINMLGVFKSERDALAQAIRARLEKGE